MKKHVNEFLKKAMNYAKAGFCVIPITPKDKKPLVQWAKYQAERPSNDQIRQWWKEYPDANVGIITGKISGMAVVDIDERNGGSKSITNYSLPKTVTVKTGGGFHYYFKYPEIGMKSRNSYLPGVDIKADGGFVVAPPSIHSSGKKYEEINAFENTPLADLPQWVLESRHTEDLESIDWDMFRKATNSEGQRNVKATQYAGKLLYDLPEELWESEGWPTLDEWNKTKNKPPLLKKELRCVWESVAKMEAQKRGPVETIEKIDISKFRSMSAKELIETLGITIKRDEENKLATFLCELATYTEDSQFNISFNAPSSTGKSYIPTEIARLFPEKDVFEVGYCSPTAFFHNHGKYDEKLKGYIVDLSRKIIIFLDQPHTQLLEHLRPLLSHDKKQINVMIADKTHRHGLKTKNIKLIGYPSVIFCTAGLKLDEQEMTRFLLLSPDSDQEKIREAILEKIKKEVDGAAYRKEIEENPKRISLKQRILGIRQEGIKEIKIGSPDKIKSLFLGKERKLKPRHQRDIGRFISLVKAFALLNLWFRERREGTIIANDQDINNAYELWAKTSQSQEHNLPPYVYNLYQDVILPLFREKADTLELEREEDVRVARQEIRNKHYEVYHRPLTDYQLRQDILPMLENAGLIGQEHDPNDKRKMLIYPTTRLTASENSELGGRVRKEAK